MLNGDFIADNVVTPACAALQDGLKLLSVLNDLAVLEMQAEQYDTAKAWIEQIERFIGGEGPHISYSKIWLQAQLTLVQIHSKQGQLDEAARIVEELLNEHGTSTTTQLDWLLYHTAAEVQARLGHKEVAREYYERAVALVNEAQTPEGATFQQKTSLYYSYGQQLREWGEIEQAFGLLDQAFKLGQN